MGSIAAAALLLLLLLVTVPAVLAVTFQVGDIAGWNSGVDYTTWVSGKTFRVGDTLEFQYGPSHSVAVVDKAGFDSCDDSGAMQRFSGGDTKFDLTTVGTIHFLCPSPGHCLGGMKLSVTVLATAATPPPPSSPRSPPPSPPSPPSLLRIESSIKPAIRKEEASDEEAKKKKKKKKKRKKKKKWLRKEEENKRKRRRKVKEVFSGVMTNTPCCVK